MSNRRKRVARPKGELEQELNEQLVLLVHACSTYDSGLEPIGKHIALSLRVLLHHHGQSKALLEQLGIRNKRFLDTARELNPRNILSDCTLASMRLGGGESKYLALCQAGGGAFQPSWLRFPDWWNKNIIKDEQGRFFNRRELVLNVANTDGGGHVDPTLDEAYLDLSRKNSLGWTLVEGDVQKPFPSPVFACIRQIAHETLETVKVKAGDSIECEYAV